MKAPNTIIASFIALPLVAGMLFMQVLPIAHGAGANTVTASCSITADDLDGIGKAQLEGLMAELNVRKALLKRIIACAKTEAQSLADQMNKLSVVGEAKALQSQLGDRLNDAINYYDLELIKTNDAGIIGTQAIAREVLAWRAANYAPLTGEVSNFVLWEKNQNLFKIANDRFNQMKKVVAFLEQAAPPSAGLSNALQTVRVAIERANSENESARTALIQFWSPDQSLPIIQESLDSLADAYQKFLAVSTIIQKLLAPSTNQ
jgi:hypothetical protein